MEDRIKKWKALSEKFSVIPLNGKIPIEAGWERWCIKSRPFKPGDFVGRNAGIACGPASGCIVLDIDDEVAFKKLVKEKSWELPLTYKVKTGSGKYHLYFAYKNNGHEYGCSAWKELNAEGKKYSVFDIRGKGGQVVAPFSIHPDTGRPYEIERNCEFQEAPQWLLNLCKIVPEPVYEKSGPIGIAKQWTGSIDDLPISQESKDLIMNGSNVGDRSESIMSVCNALVFANLSDHEIVQIFDQYPIGDKYREKRRTKGKWLMKHIQKARSYVTEHAEDSFDAYFSKFAPNKERHGASRAKMKTSVSNVTNREQREQREQREHGEHEGAKGSIEGAKGSIKGCNANLSNKINVVSTGSMEGANNTETEKIKENQHGERFKENDESDTQINTDAPSPAERGFMCELRDWIKNSTGSFTTRDIDNEFNLRTRKEKNARARALYKYIKEKIIIKDRAIQGKYHILSDDVVFLNPFAAKVESYDIKLPLGINNMVEVPPKSIIIVAGATNAGKTALLLNMASINLDLTKSPMYLMSEMGSSEYRKRLERFPNIPPAMWLRMKVAEKSSGFNSVIWNHNRCGITFVDFLEDIGGEYFKLAASIREIYDALDNGIAVIALQKKRDQVYGRGGESTAEKARLYLSLDSVMQCNDFSICSLKIVKAKDYTGSNPNGKECFFKLYRGTTMEQITQWGWMDERERNGQIKHFQGQYGSFVRQ